jgi:hypothetical protein
MTPRRLWAFLAVFLAVAAAYFLMTWREQRQEQAKQAAQRLYQVKDSDITTLNLKRVGASIHLEKKGDLWEITKPIQAKADKDTVASLLLTLASLNKERDLGEEKDLQPFGLKNPAFMVEFTAGGKAYQLSVGNATPGKQGYYALADQKKDLVIIKSADKEALDRPLTAFRDKTLFAFSLGKVNAVKIRLDSRQVELEKKAPNTWKWVGREGVKVRADRVDSLLRRLDMARIKDFVAESPNAKELSDYGLAKPLGAITLAEEKSSECLFLGVSQRQDLYARRGSAGPVFLVEERLKQDLEQALGKLEDRRLWSGDVALVHKVTWGPPDKAWTAFKEEKGWKLTGPGQESLTQPGLRLEMALQKFQDLEYARLAPQAWPPEPQAYLFELRGADDQVLVRLTSAGRPEKDQVAVSVEHPGTADRALVSLKAYQDWQADWARLTQEPGKARE